jgi:hypothetical protein
VKREKRRCPAFSEIPVQDTGVDCRQIDEHQGIDCVREPGVDVDPNQSGIQLQVLAKQYRNALAALDVSYSPVELVHGAWYRVVGGKGESSGSYGIDQFREILVQMVLP